jgi:2'-5' RNA ligase
MHGIVSLPDEAHESLIKNLWDEIEGRFGLQDIALRPIPHFSYQVADTYDLDRLQAVLQSIAHNTAPFQVKTTGLGIFTGSSAVYPVLYVPVVRSAQLTAFQRLIWYETLPLGTGVADYYAPDSWIPHISLADDNLDHEHLPDLIRYLSQRDFVWTFTVNALAVINDTGEGTGMDFHITFG